MWRNRLKKGGIKMPDFSEAELGDRVFSITKGWGGVVQVDRVKICVDFGDLGHCSYTLDGKEYRNDLWPALYWDEVTLNIPKSALTLPKRKVKKYILYDKFRDSGSVAQFRIFGDQQLADVCRESWSDRYDGPFEIEIEE